MFGRKRRARLAHENTALREALYWYATRENWRKRSQRVVGKPRTWIKSAAAFDRGAKAKFVLTQLDSYQPVTLVDRLLDMLLGPDDSEPVRPTMPAPLPASTQANDIADVLARRAGTE